jgi:hypothetical protein
MAALTTQKIVAAGTVPTLAAASTSDTAVVNDGRTNFLWYKNTGAQKTVTVATPGLLDTGDAHPPKVYTLPATTGELMIPLIKRYDDGTGRATITLSPDATGVTVAVVQR